MAGKEPLRILAFALCAVSFALLSVAVYTDHWREQQSSSGFGIQSGKAFEGLWNNCWWDSTGQTHCYPQPYSKNNRNGQGNIFNGNSGSLSLPSRFYFYRGLTVIGLLTNFVGLLFLMTGLKCIDISFRRKIKMQMGAGFNGVACVCVLATLILFKINEWNQAGSRTSSSMGMGMYLLVGFVVLEVAAVALAVAGLESDDSDYSDENTSFQPKGYQSQPGSIVHQGNPGSSYI